MVFVKQLIGLDLTNRLRRPSTTGRTAATGRALARPKTPDRMLVVALSFALVAFLASTYYAFFAFSADDALIVARYARNAIAGRGLVFNPGETIAALTSPFHAILLTAVSGLTETPVIAYKLLCIGLVTATLVWISFRFFAGGLQRIAFLCLTAASPFVILWTVGGLETPLLLCTLGMFFATAWRREDEPDSIAVYLLAALAFLIRHDSALLTAPVIASQIVANRNSPKHWVALLVAAIGPIGWLVFSHLYYGDFLPTSFYLKRPDFGPNIVLGAIYLMSFLTLSGGLPALFARGRPAWPSACPPRRNWPALVGLATYCAYAVAAGIVHMMFAYRIYVPVIPIVMLIAVWLGRSLDSAGRAATMAAVALVLQAGLAISLYTATVNPTLLHAFGAGAPKFFEYTRQGLASYAHDFLPAMESNASEAREHWQSNGRPDRAPRVHTFAAGVLPYAFEHAYIFDSLSGYRHGCELEWTYWRRAADYMHIMWPRHGSLEDQLGHLAAQAELVSRRVITFDGRQEHLDVYYNPRPDPRRNSDRIDRSC